MAVTTILARKGPLDVGVPYVLNGDHTEQQNQTGRQGRSTEHDDRSKLQTKRK